MIWLALWLGSLSGLPIPRLEQDFLDLVQACLVRNQFTRALHEFA